MIAHACTRAQDEDTLAASLQSNGPVSIVVDASSWQTYASGVFDADSCSTRKMKMDHAVQLVGFDADASTPDGRFTLGLEFDDSPPSAYVGRWLDHQQLQLDDEGDEW